VAAALEGERRWATVLFGDLAGFTHLSEGADPEEVRLIVDRYTSRMGEIVDGYGGWIDKVIGDALMAVFGAPVTHEDDAERAVRAGLEIQRYALTCADELGGLAFRVGIQSGEVMFAPVGPEGSRRLTVMGDTVNTAWRLQEVAPEGGVLVGEETRSACSGTICCDAVQPIAVKGKDAPVSAWLAKEAAPSNAPEAVPRRPILGREAEFETLSSAWDRAVELRRPQLVSLLGPAGIGKTRLCRELMQHVQSGGGRVIHGKSLPYGEKTGYGAFAQMIRSVTGILEADPRGRAREKLRRRIEALPDVEEPQSVLAHTALLAGFAEDGVERRSQLFLSARELVGGLARERPTLFIFEDNHWANPSLLDLIESLAAHLREVPAMFLATARAELLDARPEWGRRLPRHDLISLEPLPPEEGRRLALRLLGDVSGPKVATEEVEQAATEVEQAAGGNPLFIEELATAMAEGTADPARRLPVAVRVIIAARLDALPADERRLMLHASVVGTVFTRGQLECMPGQGDAVPEALEDLEARDLIRRRHGPRTHDDEEFSFKHALIREVAYGTMPRAARRERHAMVAEYLESTVRSGGGTAGILAHHWREAGNSERAVRYLLSAAELAGRGWAKGEAVALYNEALELIPDDDEGRRREVELKRAIEYAAFTHINDARRARRSQESAGAVRPDGQ
jgi:class 3 adenylate cyclase